MDLPQQHSFVMFYIVCLQTDDSEATQRAVAKLIRAYDRMNPEYARSQFFSNLLIDTRNKIIESEGNGMYGHMNAVYEHINQNQAESSNNGETQDDVDEAMEAIMKQIQNLKMQRDF